MSPHSTLKPLRLAAVAMLVALTGSYAQAAEPGIVWVDNESLEFSGCGDAAALPGNQAPSELMNELREQGLANAALMARIRGLTDATITITPISAARHCDGATSSMVLSMTAVERGTGRVSSSTLMSRVMDSTSLASAPQAAEPGVVWVDNESFGFASCGGVDALPGSQDPKELMSALRERGLADAGQLVRTRGLGAATVTLTPVSGSIRCEGASSMVFRLTTFDRASGQSWTSNLVSRLPSTGITATTASSTR